MSELENDLRATAEDIAADAERLAAIEDEAATETDDPRLVELSAEGEGSPSPGPQDGCRKRARRRGTRDRQGRLKSREADVVGGHRCALRDDLPTRRLGIALPVPFGTN